MTEVLPNCHGKISLHHPAWCPDDEGCLGGFLCQLSGHDKISLTPHVHLGLVLVERTCFFFFFSSLRKG